MAASIAGLAMNVMTSSLWCLFQLLGAMKGAASDQSSGNQGKEAFHLVKPGTAGRSEVEMESFPFLRSQPTLHLDAFVGTVVVHDEVYFLFCR